MKEGYNVKQLKQHGAVSLFIVVFSALLMTVVTLSFIRLMVTNQQQASSNDLSQSAYDSAQAGVEDAKRLLIIDQTCQTQGSTTEACTNAHNAIASGSCSAVARGLGAVGPTDTADETSIQQNQAYTCVKITTKTDDYVGTLDANASAVVPLFVDAAQSFDTVTIQWFDTANLQSYDGTKVDLTNSLVTPEPLLAQNKWQPNRPSIMRAQLMQFGSNGFTLNDFDDTNATGQSDANTLFLYPRGTTGLVASNDPATSFSGNDARKTATASPTPITCTGDLKAGGYACTATLTLPQPINGGDRTAFLRVSSLYNATNYRVSLQNGGSSVQFNGVQPEIDSTGRANDLFRRVATRVTLTDANFPYPQSAVDITGNLCKDFVVTDNVADYTKYIAAHPCNP